MERGKVLALDYGTRNIGLAASDALGVTVTPLPSIPFRGRRDLLERLRGLIADNAIAEVVVGIPVHVGGTEGTSAARARKLLVELRRKLPVAVSECDERLSTVEALEVWRDLPSRRQRYYRTVDSLAAAMILERFLRGE